MIAPKKIKTTIIRKWYLAILIKTSQTIETRVIAQGLKYFPYTVEQELIPRALCQKSSEVLWALRAEKWSLSVNPKHHYMWPPNQNQPNRSNQPNSPHLHLRAINSSFNIPDDVNFHLTSLSHFGIGKDFSTFLSGSQQLPNPHSMSDLHFRATACSYNFLDSHWHLMQLCFSFLMSWTTVMTIILIVPLVPSITG